MVYADLKEAWMSETLTKITGIAGAQDLEKPDTIFAGFTAACQRLI